MKLQKRGRNLTAALASLRDAAAHLRCEAMVAEPFARPYLERCAQRVAALAQELEE